MSAYGAYSSRFAVLLCFAVGMAIAAPANAQPSSAVNTYDAAEHPDDGFMLRRPRVGAHLSWSAQLQLDYADDPLVFEDSAGDSSSEAVSLVSDQVTARFAGTLSVLDFARVHMTLPMHVVMNGSELGSQPTATGFGFGDLQVGGMLAIYSGPLAQVAAFGTLSFNTAEGGDGRPGVAGDTGASFAPRVLASFELGMLSVLTHVGGRWREDVQFSGVRFTDVLTYGLGAELPIIAERLRLHAELSGETPFDDVGDRAGSPLGALAGAKLALPLGLTVGLAGGTGLLRGYGSPDFRGVLTVGYAKKQAQRVAQEKSDDDELSPQEARERELAEPAVIAELPQAPPAPPSDRDGDAMPDDADACPDMPGDAERNGCARYLRYDVDSGSITLVEPLALADGNVQPAGEPILNELIAFLRSQTKRRVRVEAHALPGQGRRARSAVDISVSNAAAVTSWLTAHGIEARQLEGYGCGDTRTIAPTRGTGRERNERVELYVVAPLPSSGIRSSLGCTESPVGAPEPQRAPPVLREPAPAPQPAPAITAPPSLPAPSQAPVITAPPSLPAPSTAPVIASPPALAPAATTPAPAPAASEAAAPGPVLAVAGAASAASVLAAIAAAPDADRDGDGVANAKDECPLAPAKRGGCPDSHRIDLQTGQIELLTPIRFEEGKPDLKGKPEDVLDELAATLRANPTMKVALEAHAAEEAEAQATLAITRARARLVASALVKRGAKPEQLRALGCGQSRPIAPNNVPWGRKKNDRVELHLLDPAPSAGVHSFQGCVVSEPL